MLKYVVSLGQLGLKWKDLLPRRMNEKLLDYLQTLMPSEFKIIGVNGCLSGLTNMGYDWKKNEKLCRSMWRKIEGWYGGKAKISKVNDEALPTFVYAVGEGKVEWREFRKESKEALMNGIEAYCKGENVNAKKLSNMIYGLGNMGATIYGMSAVMKESLEGAVKKISRESENPQHIANIMYSFCKMQYSWEMLREDTREALLHMIRQLSREFNAQELCNTCYSIAVMIRGNRLEWEKSYFLPLQQSLLGRYYELYEMNKGEAFTIEELSQLALYMSWLETLPSSSLSSLLQSLQQDKLPDIVYSQTHKPSATHEGFTDKLQESWREVIEKEVMTEQKRKEVKIVNEYSGLRRGVFPMDIAVVKEEEGVGGGKEKVLFFIEIDGHHHKHTMKVKKLKDGSYMVIKTLDTRDQLKEYLYRCYYEDAPVEKIELTDIDNHLDDTVNNILQKMLKLIQ